MDEDFKKWLCELATDGYSEIDKLCPVNIEILIKSMWKINRGGKYEVSLVYDSVTVHSKKASDIFWLKDYKTETGALTAALKYIYDNTREHTNDKTIL